MRQKRRRQSCKKDVFNGMDAEDRPKISDLCVEDTNVGLNFENQLQENPGEDMKKLSLCYQPSIASISPELDLVVRLESKLKRSIISKKTRRSTQQLLSNARTKLQNSFLSDESSFFDKSYEESELEKYSAVMPFSPSRKDVLCKMENLKISCSPHNSKASFSRDFNVPQLDSCKPSSSTKLTKEYIEQNEQNIPDQADALSLPLDYAPMEGIREVVDGFVRLTGAEDLEQLSDNRWIGDVIVDSYLNNLQRFPTLKNPFSYAESLLWETPENVLQNRDMKTYIRGNIQASSYLFFPIFQNRNHYTLFAYDLREGQGMFYDSFQNSIPPHIYQRLQFFLEKLELNIVINEGEASNRQNDGNNCGIHMLHNITRLAYGHPAFENNFNATHYRSYVRKVITQMGLPGPQFMEPPKYDEPMLRLNETGKRELISEKNIQFEVVSKCTEIENQNQIEQKKTMKRKMPFKKAGLKKAKVSVVIEHKKTVKKVTHEPSISTRQPRGRKKKELQPSTIKKPTFNKQKKTLSSTEIRKMRKELASVKKSLKQIKRFEGESKEQYQLRINQAREKEIRIKFILRPKMFLRAIEDKTENSQWFAVNFSERCGYCGAVKTTREASALCCHNGAVQLEPYPRLPPPLEELYTEPRYQLRGQFMPFIRRFNASNSLSCVRDRQDKPEYIQHGNKGGSLRVVGKIEHQYYDLLPKSGKAPIYGQLYYLDTEEAVKQRKSISSNQKLNTELLLTIDRLLRKHHPYVKTYVSMAEKEKEERQNAEKENRKTIDLAMKVVIPEGKKGLERKTYALPTASEIAIIYRPSIDNRPDHPGFTVFSRDGIGPSYKTLDAISGFVDPLAYPLLFPHGTFGYHINIKRARPGKRKRVSMREYYCYRFFERRGANRDYIFHAGALFQQFIADACIRIDSNRFRFYKQHQTDLTKEKLNAALESVKKNAFNPNVKRGTTYFLPSNYQGCYQHIRSRFIQTLATFRQYGKPDFFITFTCNEKWPEIQNTIRTDLGETAYTRPDIAVRVMQEKLDLFIKLVKEEEVLGPVVAIICIIEFQKRGLPHAHCLIIRDKQHKLESAEEVDMFITAEIPDAKEDPELYRLITAYQIHGPCGDAGTYTGCQKEDEKDSSKQKCQANFPKQFLDHTVIIKGSYPNYRRPNNGRTVQTKYGNVDNRFVVSTNKYLIRSLNCHVNVEQCASLNSAAYLAKYFSKPPEKAAVRFYELKKQQELERRRKQPGNENLKNYELLDERRDIDFIEDVRILTSTEAIHRIYGFPLQKMSGVMYPLPVHDESEQVIYYHCNGNEVHEILRKASEDTPLTAYFKLCQEDKFAQQLTYLEVPKWYSWNRGNHQWNSRGKEDIKVVPILQNVSVRSKQFYLRTLLLHRTNATSFQDIKTVRGVVYNEYVEACNALGLFQNNKEWEDCLEQAVPLKRPRELRHLFAVIVSFCQVENAAHLFCRFKDALSHDFEEKKNRYRLAYCVITKEIANLNKVPSDIGLFYKIHEEGETDSFEEAPMEVDDAIDMEVAYDDFEERNDLMLAEIEECRVQAEKDIKKMNADQRRIFDTIVEAVNSDPLNSDLPRLFRLVGSGGTGKTFLLNTIINYFKGQVNNPLVVASTGTAATLLHNGKTAHNGLGIPLVLNESTTSLISRGSLRGDVIKNASLIIIDEVTMLKRFVLNLTDQLLRDFAESGASSLPFGGRTLIIGGDFKQLLPVVPGGSRSEIVSQSICYSELFSLFTPLHLRINMRAGAEHEKFADWLQQLGRGDHNDEQNYVELPDDIIVNTIEELLDFTFDGFKRELSDEDLSSRTILAPKNLDTSHLNEVILQQMYPEKQIYEYLSHDEPLENDNLKTMPLMNEVPIEQYYNENPSGFPPHVLRIKVGIPVLLLRNLNTQQGLVNGTKLCVTACLPNVIETRVTTGASKGKTLFLCRMAFETPDTGAELKMPFKRTQFPIKLAAAMTINKAQGQTCARVGLNLQQQPFSHGQLYVAFSRVSDFKNIRVFTGGIRDLDGKVRVRNIVYDEVLTNTEL